MKSVSKFLLEQTRNPTHYTSETELTELKDSHKVSVEVEAESTLSFVLSTWARLICLLINIK